MSKVRSIKREAASIHRMKIRQFTEQKYANSPNAIDLQVQNML